MPSPSPRWEEIYNQVPLREVPRHFAGIAGSPYLLEYLKEVLRRCPPGARACETGIGSGYGAIWLSLRGVALFPAGGGFGASGLAQAVRAFGPDVLVGHSDQCEAPPVCETNGGAGASKRQAPFARPQAEPGAQRGSWRP